MNETQKLFAVWEEGVNARATLAGVLGSVSYIMSLMTEDLEKGDVSPRRVKFYHELLSGNVEKGNTFLYSQNRINLFLEMLPEKGETHDTPSLVPETKD